MWDSMTELAMAKAKQQDLIAQAAVARQILGADGDTGRTDGNGGYRGRKAEPSLRTVFRILLRGFTAGIRGRSTASRL